LPDQGLLALVQGLLPLDEALLLLQDHLAALCQQSLLIGKDLRLGQKALPGGGQLVQQLVGPLLVLEDAFLHLPDAFAHGPDAALVVGAPLGQGGDALLPAGQLLLPPLYLVAGGVDLLLAPEQLLLELCHLALTL